ncbi:MAG: recombinase family protein [Sphaerochaetaceae bacterium]|nr:recombinase family protein [Sphaerochaetaceae bacterium]
MQRASGLASLAWPVRTIGDILSNEKCTGDSIYGQTVGDENPAMRRIRNNPDEIVRSENHHPPTIIDSYTFDRVQEMKKMRSNTELDEHGNRVRKSTRYSMKRYVGKNEKPVKQMR